VGICTPLRLEEYIDPAAIGIEEDFENYEENGFSIVDIDSRNVSVKMFKFLWSRDDLNMIDSLKPFTTV